MPEDDELLTRREAADRAGVTTGTIRLWERAGRLHAKVTVWANAGTPSDVVQHYVARLLKGLVNGRQIVVAAD